MTSSLRCLKRCLQTITGCISPLIVASGHVSMLNQDESEFLKFGIALDIDSERPEEDTKTGIKEKKTELFHEK